MEGLWNVGPADEIPLLYSIIRENPKYLQEFEELQFVDTPLHTAACKGLTQLALEILRLMPSWGRKLNPDGFTPLDLALQRQHGETVRAMITADPELIGLPGREGITPLHWAADRGDIHMIAEFLLRCPESIEKLSIRRETAVHMAVRYGNVEAFKVLLGWLQRSGKMDVLYWGDWEGNTPLHLAAYTNQPQITDLLVKGVEAVVNFRNFKGLTALDVAMNLPLPHDMDNRRVVKTLQSKSKCQEPNISSLINIKKVGDYLRSPMNKTDNTFRRRIQLRNKFSSDSRSAIIVMAVLIITVTYQGAVNPPNSKDNDFPLIGYKRYASGVFQLFNWLAFFSSVAVLVVALPYFSGLLKLSLLCTFSFLFASYITAVLIATEFSSFTFFILALSTAVCVLFNFDFLRKIRPSWPSVQGWVSIPLTDTHGHHFHHRSLVMQSVFESKKLATTSLPVS